MERHDARPMYFTTAHWKRSAQGFTGYFPPAYNYVRWRLFHFPEPESLRFARRFGIDTLIVGPEATSAARRFGIDTLIVGPEAGASPGDGGATWHGPFPDGSRVLQLRDVADAPPGPPAPLAALAEVPRAGWSVQASYPGAALAVDGDPATAWTTGQLQGKGDFFRIRFARPRRVARVSLGVSPNFEFPLRVKLLGEDPERGWLEIPIDEQAAHDRLLATLLHQPREAWMDLEIEPRTLSAIRVRIRDDDAFALPWTLPEIRVWAAPGGE
jgi:hypothetical protein